jgi:hypothetical protein
VAAGAAVGLIALFLLIVWLAGGLHTSGDSVDWQAVGALASIVAAVAATGALVAVVFAVEQLRSARRTERLSLMPYLRVDVGFEEASARHAGFEPPASRYVFDAADFGPDADMQALQPLLAKPGDPARTLSLWVSNRQEARLGNAFQVRVGLYVAWRDATDMSLSVARVTVRFAYVEPASTTNVRLVRVREDVAELVVSVFAVSYYGMYLDRELISRHGARNLYYAADQGVQNERSYRLGETT